MKDGLLIQCRTAGCNWRCCNFGKDGYILLLPHEYGLGEGSKSHLEIIDDNYFGGKKVKCKASDCSVCDNGYKPIMCRVYPYWVRSVSKDILMRSKKCELPEGVLSTHRDYVRKVFSEYNNVCEIDSFLNAVSINKYEVYDAYEKEPLRKLHKKAIMEVESAGFGDDYCFSSSEEDIDKCLQSGCSSGVVFNKDSLLGYSLAYCNEYGVGYIEKCYVKEPVRGFGLQKEMVKDNLKKLVSKGVSEVYSMCSPKNSKSLHNFQSIGFKIIRETEFQGEKRVILKWSIYEGFNR